MDLNSRGRLLDWAELQTALSLVLDRVSLMSPGHDPLKVDSPHGPDAARG